jgi:C1A family cysteine protease
VGLEPFACPIVGEPVESLPGDWAREKQPSSYDLRTSGLVTPVRDQGYSYETCWAFATFASLESNLLINEGLTEDFDFSERALAFNDFDWDCYDGGNMYISSAELTAARDPFAESEYPYSRMPTNPGVEGTLDTIRYYVRETPVYDTANEIKNAIMTRGALFTSFYANSAYFNDTTPADAEYYYYPASGGAHANHAVAIVGWDDDVSRTLFTGAGGNPPADGAWLIKNSWGTGWHGDGYFWLSYHDKYMLPGEGGLYGASFSDAVPQPQAYKTVYEYDDFGYVWGRATSTAVNAFTPTAEEDLAAVNFWTVLDGDQYDLRIYDDFSITSGPSTLLARETGTMANWGNHTVDLTDPVSLTTGDDFFVYLEITGGGDYPMAADGAFAGYSSNCTANPGESYYRWNGSWYDLNVEYPQDEANFCIKALTVPVQRIRGTKWNDFDGDGVKDDGEFGLDGWTIELVDAATDEVVATEVTAGGGRYEFTNPPPGDYVIREVPQAGWTQRYPWSWSCASGIERVSLANGGREADRSSSDASISADGRYVAFASYATDLVPGDTNYRQDVFVYDRRRDTIERVSVASDGSQANGGNSYQPSISADGTYVAFTSEAANLVESDTNGNADVFVYDRQTGTIQRVSLGPNDCQANGGDSDEPSISADGGFVAFTSEATNLVPDNGDTNGKADVFVYDRQEHTTERVSVESDGSQVHGGDSDQPSISADGRYVAFASRALGLTPNDNNWPTQDVFVHDRQEHTTELVSFKYFNGWSGDDDSSHPSISADGTYVAFESQAEFLVPGDDNARRDVFVCHRDPQGHTIRRVSVGWGGVEGNDDSTRPSISADGRYVAFASQATNLAPGDSNVKDDVLVWDYHTLAIKRVSLSSSGSQANDHSGNPSISADGRYVAFDSAAWNLVQGDTNDCEDVFAALNPPAWPRATHVVLLAPGQVVTDRDFGNRHVPGITVSPTSGLWTTEPGGSDTFTIVLDSQPTADVTIGLTSSDETEGTVSPASVTFTPGDWSTPQTVTVTGVDDYVDDGNVAYTIVTAPAVSSDPGYNGMNADNVSVTNQDDDEPPGIAVSPTAGLVTTEAGGTDTFTIRLTSKPLADVTIDLSANDATEGTVSPASVTFTPGDWSTPQTVTVTGVDDHLDDHHVAYTIVTAPATSHDAAYDDMDANDVSATNQDDDTAGFTVRSASMATEYDQTQTLNNGYDSSVNGLAARKGQTFVPLHAQIDGFDFLFDGVTAGDAFLVNLRDTDAPGLTGTILGTSDVISYSSTSDRHTVAKFRFPSSVYVTPRHQYAAELVPVALGGTGFGLRLGLENPYSQGQYYYKPTSPSTADAWFRTSQLVPRLTTNEGGDTDTLTIRLNSQPIARGDVTVGFSSSNTHEGTVSPASVRFTPANWGTAQTVTVTGVDDDVDDGNVAYTIVTAAATSTDPKYNGLDAMDAPAINLDDDTAGITVEPTSGLTTTERGDMDTFTIVLDTEPTADVTIGLISDDTTEGIVSPASVTFTRGDWDAPQTVKVLGQDDAAIDGDVAYTIVTGPAVSADSNYNGLNAADVSVTNLDDERVDDAEVVGRHIFYNNSYWDGNNPAANTDDDDAIAPDPDRASEPALGKTALLPGQTATFQNYTSYSRGINGIMVDIADLKDPDNLDEDDFLFRVGNDNNPAGWPEVTASASVSVRPHPTEAGTSRITVIWPAGAIEKQWLQVRVLATGHTGLAHSDVFYWGNAIGDSGEGNTSTFAFVTVTDELAARHNPHNLLNPAGIDDFVDYNRDRWVTVADELIARHNGTNLLNALKMITVPDSSGGGAATAAGVWSEASSVEPVFPGPNQAATPLIATVLGPTSAALDDSPDNPLSISTRAAPPAVLAAYDAVLQHGVATEPARSRNAANLPGAAWLPARLFAETQDSEDDDSAVDEALTDDWLHDWPSL